MLGLMVRPVVLVQRPKKQQDSWLTNISAPAKKHRPDHPSLCLLLLTFSTLDVDHGHFTELTERSSLLLQEQTHLEKHSEI